MIVQSPPLETPTFDKLYKTHSLSNFLSNKKIFLNLLFNKYFLIKYQYQECLFQYTLLLPNIKVMCLHHKISGKNTLSRIFKLLPTLQFLNSVAQLLFLMCISGSCNLQCLFILIDIVDYNLGTKLISQNIAPLLVGSVHAEYFSDYNLSLENLAIMLHLCLRLLSSVSWSHTLCFWRRNIGDMVSWTVRETIQVFADFFFFSN